MKIRVLFFILSLLILLAPLSSQDRDKPVVALVLAGGGALGYAHVGALQVLEEEGIVPDMVIGSSMGSIIGGLYCAGYSPLEMREMMGDMDWKWILTDSYVRGSMSFEQKNRQAAYPLIIDNPRNPRLQDTGFSHGQHVVEFLDSMLQSYPAEMDFDDLPIPFRAIGADLLTGEEIVYSQGDLKTVIRASMAVPGAFTPVEYQGRYIIDGDWVDNLPTRVARELGADIVIAVSLYTMKKDLESLTTMEAVNYQAFLIRTIERQRESYSAADLIIAPQFSEFSIVDFENAEELIQKGYTAADSIRGEIGELSSIIGSMESRSPRIDDDPVIPLGDIRINGGGEDSSELRVELLEELGENPLESELRDFLYSYYDGGDYSHFWYQLLENGTGEYHLIIDAPRRAKQKESFSLGLEFTSQLPINSVSSITLKAAYRRWFGEEQNRSFALSFGLSSFPRFQLSLDQAMWNRSLVLRAEGHYYQLPRLTYQEGSLESLYSLSVGGGSLTLALPVLKILEISGSLYADSLMLHLRQGSAGLDQPDWGRFGLRALGVIDTLDRVFVPRSGVNAVFLLESSYDGEKELLGYSQTAGEAFYPFWDKQVILSPRWESVLLHWGVPRHLELPALGEMGTLRGFKPQELRSDYALSAGLDLRIKAGALPLGAGDEFYFHLAGYAAYLWQNAVSESYSSDNLYKAVTAGLLFNTLIGEVELDLSLNHRGNVSAFLGLSSSTLQIPGVW